MRGTVTYSNLSSASRQRVALNLENLVMMSAILCSPWTLVQRVRTLAVLFSNSFSPTTRMKLNWAICALRTFLFSVLPSSTSASHINPASCNCCRTWLAYSLNGGATGTTIHCLGDSQNGLKGGQYKSVTQSIQYIL